MKRHYQAPAAVSKFQSDGVFVVWKWHERTTDWNKLQKARKSFRHKFQLKIKMTKNLDIGGHYWTKIKSRIKLPSAHRRESGWHLCWVWTFPSNIPHTLVTGDRDLNFRVSILLSFWKRNLMAWFKLKSNGHLAGLLWSGWVAFTICWPMDLSVALWIRTRINSRPLFITFEYGAQKCTPFE